jgi:hypothetical protein
MEMLVQVLLYGMSRERFFLAGLNDILVVKALHRLCFERDYLTRGFGFTRHERIFSGRADP